MTCDMRFWFFFEKVNFAFPQRLYFQGPKEEKKHKKTKNKKQKTKNKMIERLIPESNEHVTF